DRGAGDVPGGSGAAVWTRRSNLDASHARRLKQNCARELGILEQEEATRSLRELLQLDAIGVQRHVLGARVRYGERAPCSLEDGATARDDEDTDVARQHFLRRAQLIARACGRERLAVEDRERNARERPTRGLRQR